MNALSRTLLATLLVSLSLVGCASDRAIPDPTATTMPPTPTPVNPTPTVTSPPQPGMDLPFDTINGGSSGYKGIDARLIVISVPYHVPLLPGVSIETFQKLDYEKVLVIALYQGWRGNCPHGRMGIERITYDGDRVVRVEATLPCLHLSGEKECALVDKECSLYHIVSMAKLGAMTDKQVKFVLVANGEEIIKQRYWIGTGPY